MPDIFGERKQRLIDDVNVSRDTTFSSAEIMAEIAGFLDTLTTEQVIALRYALGVMDIAGIASRLYPGADLTQRHQAEIAAAPFNGNPWAWIQARIRASNFTGILPGDFIPLVIAGNTYRMEVAGINPYLNYGSPAVTIPHIDFISRELWPETIQWNRANYNNGIAAQTTPFLASNVNAFINSLQADVPNATTANPALINVDFRSGGILSQIPAQARAVMIGKNALMEARHTAGVLLTENNSWAWRTMGELWLPSEIEVYGCRQWGSNVSPNQGFSSGGYIQYPIFAANMKRLKNIVGTSTRAGWWLVSARGGDSTRAAIVDSSGVATHPTASHTGVRVPVCFRVA